MIHNSKAISENEFMSRKKMILLQTISTLKGLAEDEELVKMLVERSKGEESEMLSGVKERLMVLAEKYPEDSYGNEALNRIIADLRDGGFDGN